MARGPPKRYGQSGNKVDTRIANCDAYAKYVMQAYAL